MYSRPSSSTRRAPRPSRKNTGVPPTARKARTGEFTPPGMSSRERSKSARLRSYMGCRILEKVGEGARRGAHIGCLEYRRDHGEHVGPGIDGGFRIRGIDATDRGYGQAANSPGLREHLQ